MNTDKQKTVNLPPKFAVAIEYDGTQAPVVTARGHHQTADQILQVAKAQNIPVHEDEALSILLSQLNIGDKIPETLYVVIAEVLTFAYRLSGKHKDFMDDIEN